MLIDFSLAGYPAKEIDAGTEGYLDPFLGVITRGSYDGHAERYALAVTLHEMASNELPRWGDGGVTARQTDPKEWPYPHLAADAFEPAVGPGLAAFFRKALARDVKDRFSDLKPMERAWQAIFLDAQRTTAPSSGHGTAESVVATREAESQIGREADDASAEQVRDQQAARADGTTSLSVAGLTLSAQSQLFALGLNTVEDVLKYSARKFLTAPGMGSRTREEIQRRQKEWNLRLGKAAPAPLSAEARKAAGQEITELEQTVAESVAVGSGNLTDPQLLSALSLDALATRLVPRPSGGNARSNTKEREAIRLLLRLPDEAGKLPAGLAWVRQRDVADAVGLTAGRIPQIVKKARERWYEDPALGLLREQVVELLAERGRVAPVIELADALIARRGTQHVERRDRRALALSLLRAVVERESYDNESPQLFRYFHARMPKGADPVLGLLALDVREGVDGPDTPTLPALQDYALSLGARADRLAALESLPTASTVLTELDAVRRPPGSLGWDERRTAEIAVAASTRAALTPRLEIYPRDLHLVRALRITQAGVVAVQPGVEEERQPGLTVDALHKRVATRFPELGTDPLAPRELPTGSALVRDLKQAGFELKLATRYDKVLRLIPDRPSGDFTAGLTSASWGASAARRSAPTQYDADTAIAAAVKAEQRLDHSARQDGFRVLTVPQRRAEEAVRRLAGEPYGARPVSLTGLFVAELRGVVARVGPSDLGDRPQGGRRRTGQPGPPAAAHPHRQGVGAHRTATAAAAGAGTRPVAPHRYRGARPVRRPGPARPARGGGTAGRQPAVAARRPVRPGTGAAAGRAERAVPGGVRRVDRRARCVGHAQAPRAGCVTRLPFWPDLLPPLPSPQEPLVIDRKSLLADLQKQVKAAETDLEQQVKALPEVGRRLRGEYEQARKLGRTAATWNAWLGERITQVAVAWVLGTVFVRFSEDNRLIAEPYITAPDVAGRETAQARYEEYLEKDADPTYRGWLETAFAELGAGQAGRLLFDRDHNPLYQIPLSHDGAGALLAFWRSSGPAKVKSTTVGDHGYAVRSSYTTSATP